MDRDEQKEIDTQRTEIDIERKKKRYIKRDRDRQRDRKLWRNRRHTEESPSETEKEQ